MQIITYDDFAKLDIRIGTIKSVELVEGADRLLKLEVDVGEEECRQIVSGIREFFLDIDELVGKQCPFLINLETKSIRGLESQGMILAAGTEGVFAMLHPGSEMETGTKVR